ncbi:hypothetical protein C0638_14545 [Paenibacillus sp. lzh-N1]|nr:hypothetical protein RE92_18315 [Paenibacillus polymyxa]AUO07662.1 hypothetical protein C0638_14545 [Paenibacillus sp. lzh-N1]
MPGTDKTAAQPNDKRYSRVIGLISHALINIYLTARIHLKDAGCLRYGWEQGKPMPCPASPVKEDQPSVGSSSFVKPLKAYFTTVDTA